MKRFLNRYWKIGLTLLFGLAVFLFWRYRYPFALTYQEQFQLFLFDDDYLLGRLGEPGGLARYLAEFLVQFYNSVTIGALILAVLFMLVQRLTWCIMFRSALPLRSAKNVQWYALSFLPAILLWYAMGDESVLLTYVVALILALTAVWLYPKNKYARWVYLIVLIPLLYWLIGPMVLLVALCLMPWPLAVAGVLYALACIFLSAHLLPFPITRLILGIGYYRFPETLPYVLMAIPVVVFALRFVGLLRVKGSNTWVGAGLSVAVLLIAVLLIPRGFDARKYELIEYDYLVRIKDWKGIIAKAEQKSPDLPMSVSALNLALGMTNQLGERAFDFYQHGSEGLLPKFERKFTTAQVTGEIYFHLGLVNTAQRFAFESMEALPNYNKSARAVKRLAETNLINGQYAVARKYLLMLQKTIFYRPWATRTMALLGNEEAINNHPLYGWLRKARLENDILFSEDETDKICGQLFLHNQQNAMAMQYLVMAPLLDGDAQRFVNYAAFVQSKVNYNPRYVREAIAKIRRMQ